VSRWLREQIEALFRQLDRVSTPADDVELLAIVDGIYRLSVRRGNPAARPASYRMCSPETARAELDRAAALAEKLLEAIEGWHAPTIGAVADAGFMRGEIQPWLRGFAAALRRATPRAHSDAATGRGRPPAIQAMAIAALAIRGFEHISDSDPRQPGQAAGLTALVTEIFALTGIAESAEAAVRAAMTERNQ
jgi:hypothetical protein